MTTKCTFTQPLASTARDGGPWILSKAMLKAPVLKTMLENGEGRVRASDGNVEGNAGVASAGKGQGKRKASAVAEGDETGDKKGSGGGGTRSESSPKRRKVVQRKPLATSSNLRLADRVAAGHDDARPGIKTYLSENESLAWKSNLTFVDLSNNVNKFYTLEALVNGSSYALFTRWGRIGQVWLDFIRYTKYYYQFSYKTFTLR